MKKVLLGFMMSFMLVSNSFAWSTQERTHYYGYVVKDKYMTKICFEASSSFYYNDTEWLDILSDSVDNYNSTFSSFTKVNFFFSPYYSASDCSFVVFIGKIDDIDEDYMAKTSGFSSYWKKPASRIDLNMYYIDSKDTNEKTHVLMHEMGHVIGIKHTGANQGNIIPFLTGDPEPENSLMRPAGIVGNIYGNFFKLPEFNDYDIMAIGALYSK